MNLLRSIVKLCVIAILIVLILALVFIEAANIGEDKSIKREIYVKDHINVEVLE